MNVSTTRPGRRPPAGRRRVLAALVAAACALTAAVVPASSATARDAGGSHYQVVGRFFGPMPTGVTVSRHGRVFVNFPRWGDDVPFTVAELRGGRPVPYPDAEINREDPANLAGHLQSVQSVVVDPDDRLWILDTGSPLFAPTSFGGPKLIAVDLRTNQVVRRILFPPDVALPSSYLNDVRFDLRRGRAGMAFITDSSPQGSNALIAVDLATGRSWRRLAAHPSVHAEPQFLPIIDGAPFMNRPPDAPATFFEVGADGIALSADGTRLYYCPLSSRRLYSVGLDALADPAASDSDVAATVTDLGAKPMADGLESDNKGRVYGGDLEHNALWRRLPGGRVQTLARGPRLVWADTLSVAADGYLYATANQLNRQPGFHNGQDLRRKPYLLVRLRIDAGPVALR